MSTAIFIASKKLSLVGRLKKEFELTVNLAYLC